VRTRVATGLRTLLAVLALLAVPSTALAGAITLSVETPEFLIPIGGQTGRLTVFADGCPPSHPGGCGPRTTGFDALGSQTYALAGNNTSSSGTLFLDLVFFGSPLGDPLQLVTSAILQFSVFDLDLLPDQVTTKITLTEVALITGVNGGSITPIKLIDYLPDGISSTDDVLIDLDPITLFPGPLSPSAFDYNPMTLSLKLKATATNKGTGTVTLVNTPEQIFGDMHLTFESVRVPEPSTLVLLGIGLAASIARRRAR
jgi:hypothetical protein